MKTKLHKIIRNSLIAVIAFIAVSLVSLPAYAAPTPEPAGSSDTSEPCPANAKGGVFTCDSSYSKSCKSKNDCNVVDQYLNPFIKFLSIIVGIAVTIGIITGGIQYASSAGDPQKANKGKEHIWASVIALIMYLFLYALLKFMLPKDAL